MLGLACFLFFVAHAIAYVWLISTAVVAVAIYSTALPPAVLVMLVITPLVVMRPGPSLGDEWRYGAGAYPVQPLSH